MERNKRIKIGAMVGALALAVAMPATLALANDDAGTTVDHLEDGVICFEIESHSFGGVELEGLPFEGGWFEFETPAFDGGWTDDFDGELLPLPDDFLEFLNQESADLAAHLDAAGIAYEMVDGPMGEMWVEWDFEDEAANAAVEEFFEGREDPFGEFEVSTADIAFDDELMELPEELVELLNAEAADLAAYLDAAGIAHEVVDGPMGDMWVEWDFEDEAANAAVEEFFEGREDPFGGFEGFEGEFPFDEFDEFGEGFIGPFEICVETPTIEAERFSDEMAGLSAALTEAGVSFTTRTIEVEVPVWDTDDEAASDAAAGYFTELYSGGWGEIEFEDPNGS